MPLIRGEHFVDGQFAQIPNIYLRDGRLSLKARGLLALLMSHKEGWSLSIQSLVDQNKEGRDAIRSAVAELEELGYLVRYQENENGRFGEVVFITTDPADLPLSENPLTDNPTPKNTKNKENYLSKNTKEEKTSKKETRIATLLPEDFEPTDENWQLMKEHFPWVDLKKQTHAFIDYWLSAPPSKAKKTDWQATWRNWIRRAADYNKPQQTETRTRYKFTMEEE